METAPTPTRIPEKLFFRIGEVCDLIKVQPHVLRYWETEFPMLAPEKNRAGQRVYRRRDVEMVMRIRTLLYEEKFTIAGAKKKLQEEMQRGGSRAKGETRQSAAAPDQPTLLPEPPAPPATAASALAADTMTLTPQARRAIKIIRRDLEGLLTLLNSDASIKS